MQGGGVTTCKCINSNCISGDSNGSGGKITVEFTIHVYERTGSEFYYYVKEDDVAKLFNEILAVDQKKYMFYLTSIQNVHDIDGIVSFPSNNSNTCSESYRETVVEGKRYESFTLICFDTTDLSQRIVLVMENNGNKITYIFNYHDNEVDIVSVLPDTVTHKVTYNLTLYYRER